MTSRQAKIQEDTHFRIMRILQDNPDLMRSKSRYVSVLGRKRHVQARRELGATA